MHIMAVFLKYFIRFNRLMLNQKLYKTILYVKNFFFKNCIVFCVIFMITEQNLLILISILF